MRMALAPITASGRLATRSNSPACAMDISGAGIKGTGIGITPTVSVVGASATSSGRSR